MSNNRVRLWFTLFVLVVFLLGLAGGLLLGSRLAPVPGPPEFAVGERFPGRGLGGGPGRPPSRMLVERLTEQLALTPDQQTQIENVLKARRDRLRQLQGEINARFEKEQDELRSEIRAFLTPEQLPKFEEWIKQEGLRGPGRRGRGPRPPIERP